MGSREPAADSLVASIDALGLDPGPTAHLKDRWLDQLTWFESKASRNQGQHRRLRVLALVGGVALPLVVNLSANDASDWMRLLAVGLSLLVGVAVAIESFLRPGERWLQYRQTAEMMRSEWWLFVSLAGDYAAFASIADAHVRFVKRVEAIINDDVAGFVAIMSPSIADATPEPPSVSPSVPDDD